MNYELWFCRNVTKVNSLSLPARRRRDGKGSVSVPALPPNLPFSPELNPNKGRAEVGISQRLEPWCLPEVLKNGGSYNSKYLTNLFHRVSGDGRIQMRNGVRPSKRHWPQDPTVYTSGERTGWDGHLNSNPTQVLHFVRLPLHGLFSSEQNIPISHLSFLD